MKWKAKRWTEGDELIISQNSFKKQRKQYVHKGKYISFLHPFTGFNSRVAYWENISLKRIPVTASQLCSVAQSCPTFCETMNCSTPGLPVHHQFLELNQTHVHWVGDAIQTSHPLSSPSPPAFNLSQHQGLFKWVSSLHQVAKVLELQLQHQSFQWIFRTDFL